MTEAVLNAEIKQHLEHKTQPNRPNGTSCKTVKPASGCFQLDAPRDRHSTFEPQLIKKHQTILTNEMDRQILSMFSMGMSYRDIHQHIEELYGVNTPLGTIYSVFDKQFSEIKA